MPTFYGAIDLSQNERDVGLPGELLLERDRRELAVAGGEPNLRPALELQSLRPGPGDWSFSVHTWDLWEPMPAGMPGTFIVVLISHRSPVSAARTMFDHESNPRTAKAAATRVTVFPFRA